jgi:hypothetical protein
MRAGRAGIGSKNHEFVGAGDVDAGDHDGQKREVANLVGKAIGGETERVKTQQIRGSGPEGPERLVRNISLWSATQALTTDKRAWRPSEDAPVAKTVSAIPPTAKANVNER